MNTELFDELNIYLLDSHLENAIDFAEKRLKTIQTTDFHKIIGRNLLHLVPNVDKFLDDFYRSANNFYQQRGFFNIFKRNTSYLKAICCEINKFTVCNDLWVISLYSYYRCGELDDLEWFSDFDFISEKNLTITGFEDIQTIYKDYVSNQKWRNNLLDSATTLKTCCNLRIINNSQILLAS